MRSARSALHHPTVSVVIPTYRRCASVHRALEALAQQNLPQAEYEVIVSIDGSEDGTRELVAGYPASFDLRHVWEPNRGRAAACNAGIASASGDLIVVLDDDMEPAPGCLAAHVEAHRSQPRLGVVGAVPITTDASSPPLAQYMAAKFERHLEKLARRDYVMGLRDFYTGNFSMPRQLFSDVGGFDPVFTVYGNEDLELWVRLRRSGIRIIYSPTALAHQHYEKDFPALARDTVAKGRTAVLLARKHPEMLPDLQLSAYGRSSRRWRLLRAGLLAMTRIWPGAPSLAVRVVERIEHRRPRRLDWTYRLALDYLYWVGAARGLREERP